MYELIVLDVAYVRRGVSKLTNKTVTRAPRIECWPQGVAVLVVVFQGYRYRALGTGGLIRAGHFGSRRSGFHRVKTHLGFLSISAPWAELGLLRSAH